MIIGVPKEVKNNENRVGLTEAGVKQLISEGHKVLVQENAGLGSMISNEQYSSVGAEIIKSAEEIYKKSEMIIKVKEPIEQEYTLLEDGQILYTYLHLAAVPKLADVLIKKKIKSVAYETIEDSSGGLPLLKPMSEVAGRMATQIGAFYLQKDQGGKGVLLGGVTGVNRGKVVIIGGGVVGTNAAKMAVGLGASVTILDVSSNRLEYLDDIFSSKITTLYSNSFNIEKSILDADLVIGAVLIPGRKAPKLVDRDMISRMIPGSVLVDVAVDQGGCIETCTPTTHENPIFFVDGVLHYCVANMPGVVARTSTYALTNATFQYASKIANQGLEKAASQDPFLEKGINVYGGFCTYEPVAKDLKLEFKNFKNLI